MSFGGRHLGLRALDLLLLADALKRFEMRLARLILAASLRIRDLRIIHQFARKGSFLQQLLPIFEELLRGVNRLLGGLHIRLGLADLLGNRRACRGTVIRFRLLELPLAFGCGRSQVAAFQLGYKLALLHMVAAVDVELPHRRADFRHHVGPIAREQHSVCRNDAADRVLSHRLSAPPSHNRTSPAAMPPSTKVFSFAFAWV